MRRELIQFVCDKCGKESKPQICERLLTGQQIIRLPNGWTKRAVNVHWCDICTATA